jgi:hypothetical protein
MRLNNPESCFICRRRADGRAVGKPAKLGWFCRDCTLELALKAIAMQPFDVFEQRAVEAVAKQLPADNFNFPADELPAFLQWVVDAFGEAVRKEVEGGKAPF